MAERFFPHAWAVVRNRNSSIPAGGHVHLARFFGADKGLIDLDGNASPLRHRVTRIGRQVDENSLELRGINFRIQARYGLNFQANPFP